jgi:hypothetical protein
MELMGMIPDGALGWVFGSLCGFGVHGWLRELVFQRKDTK